MADGKIVYEVRVDSTNVDADIDKSKGKINSGISGLISLGKSSASKLGNAVLSFFKSEGVGAKDLLDKVNSGFSGLNSVVKPLSGAFTPLNSEMKKLAQLDFSKLLSFFEGLKNVDTAKVSALTTNYSGSGMGTNLTRNTPAAYRSGKDYVPYDDYPAVLHKGEAVLTSAENQALKSMGGIEGIAAAGENKVSSPNVTVNVPETKVPEQNINLSVELDGYEMARVVARATNEMNRQLNTRIMK